MNTSNLLGESEFHARVDAVFAAIESAFDDGASDIDSEMSGGILTLEFADRSKIILNRQAFNREIWVAAKSGGFHFRFDGIGWRNTRTDESLESLLTRVIQEQSGSVMSITF